MVESVVSNTLNREDEGMSEERLTMAVIEEIFTEEIENHGGKVSESVLYRDRLLLRSVLPYVEDVGLNDPHQGGVALKAAGCSISVHPYVHREFCKNGAVMARVIGTHHLEDVEFLSLFDATERLREAVVACCSKDVFKRSAKAIHSSIGDNLGLDLALDLLPMLRDFQPDHAARFFDLIMDNFFGTPDHSRFGLMNAVTSVARDTSDPDDKWNLEALGGAIGAGILPFTPEDERGAELEIPNASTA